jgi:P27 family predicted phage terminase small subunit
MRGRKPRPTALRRLEGNRGKRGYNLAEPMPPEGVPSCPSHLSPVARREWRRVARSLHAMGVLTRIDRAALAAYAQCYGRWVEAEEKLRETPTLYKTPAGYIQQSPWLGIANKQLELMGRYMTELGMTPAARSRISVDPVPEPPLLIDGSLAKEKLTRMLDAIAARLPKDAESAAPAAETIRLPGDRVD